MNLTRLELARMHVACADALGLTEFRQDGRDPRQRAAFAELVGTCPFLLAEAIEASFALQEELDCHPGPHRFSGRELVTALYAQELAGYAARLIGARCDGTDWTTAEPGEVAKTVKLSPDFWHLHLMMKAETVRPKKVTTE